MKKVSLSVIILVIILGAFVMISSVSADTAKTIMATGTLQDAINSANPGDTIQLTDKSYEPSVNIDKDLTIKGAITGHTILTTFNIVDEASKVKLENINVSARMNNDYTLIDVQTQVELEISNFRLVFASSGKDGNEDPWNIDSKIIHMGEKSSNSKLNIHDSYLSGMFDTLNVESSGNTIEITKTTINSDCPIILRNGSNNKVTVTDCEIVAGSSYIPSEEECISIINQNGTTIDFIDTTLKGMKIPAEKSKTNDLISFDDANSTNVKVNFKGASKIIDGNMVKGSDIFNFGACSVDSGNTIYLENSVQVFINNGTDYNPELQEATLEEEYNTSENYFVVGVYDNYGVTIKQYQKNELITEDALPKKVTGEPGIPGKLGCDISNWYTNKDLSNEFKPTETPINKNMNLYPKYVDLVYVTIGEYNFELQKGQKLSDIQGQDLENKETVNGALNSIKQEKLERFSRYVDYEGNTVEEGKTTFEKNDEITAKFNVQVTVKDGQSNKQIALEEGKSLDDLENGENKTYIEGIKNAENFSRFVNEQGETVEASEPINKDITLTVKHTVKLSFDGLELSVRLEEGSTLQNLTEEERQVLKQLEVVEGKNFDHFENEEGEKVDGEKQLTKDTKLTAKYTVTVKIGNETFTLNEGEALEDLKGEEESKFNSLIEVEGKTFSHFEKADGTKVQKGDAINLNTELTPKYTVKVKVKLNGMELDFVLNENESLDNLDNEKKAQLDALILKDNKNFVNFVDGQGKVVKREDKISKDCELTPKYTVTVKIKDKTKTFTLNEGENLNNLEAGEQGILKILTKAENKTFSHFVNEAGEKVTMDTPIENNVTLTPKYTVEITIGVQKYSINEGETLEKLSEEGKSALNILKNDKENFARLVDENGNTIEMTTPITKNTTVYAKFNMIITVKDTELSLKIEEGKTFKDLMDEKQAEINAAVIKENKTFSHFVDESGTKITNETKFNKNTELTAKYTVKVTVKGTDLEFELEEGQKLNDLTSTQKAQLEKVKNVENKTFKEFQDKNGKSITMETAITENTELTEEFSVNVTIGDKTFTLNEGETLANLGEDGKQALENLKKSRQDFSRLVDSKQNTVDENTAINEHITISAKFKVTITIGEEEFKLEEGLTLNDLSVEDKARLEKLKEPKFWQKFSKLVDSETKEEVTNETALKENITLEVVFENAENSTVDTNSVGVKYRTHVQDMGWQVWKQNGEMAGTLGRGLRLEGIEIGLQNVNVPGSVVYTTHVQNQGWQGEVKDGAMAGTYGKSYRLEAIKIRLTGELANKYDIYYSVHSQEFGWLGWAKNGEPSGTEGYSYRLEGIKIVLVEKGGKAPGSTENAFKKAPPSVVYTTQVQEKGWQKEVKNGATAGTLGQSLRLEGIRISLNNSIGGGIEYRTHIQNTGWEKEWKTNGATSGTVGKSLRLEAIQIRLTGEMANKYDVYYRVHSQEFGWLGWAKNGASAGTAGYSYRLEGIEIRLVEKGGKAPESTVSAFKSK